MVGLSEIPESGGVKSREPKAFTAVTHGRIRKVHSKDTLDIQTKCGNIPLKSCILISKGDGSDEKISVKKAKSVHFADTLGKPLKSVKTLTDPTDDLFGLNFLSLRSSTRRSFPINQNIFKQTTDGGKIDKEECLNFKHPLEFKDLKTRVENENVCLDKISFIRDNGIFGTVVVKNLCFKKDVSIKYTLDNWKTENTEVGKYVSTSYVENADTFSFEIVPKQQCNEVNIIFAICFTADGISYWDSNFGNNYSVLYKTEKQNECSVTAKNQNNGFILPKQNFIGWAT